MSDRPPITEGPFVHDLRSLTLGFKTANLPYADFTARIANERPGLVRGQFENPIDSITAAREMLSLIEGDYADPLGVLASMVAENHSLVINWDDLSLRLLLDLGAEGVVLKDEVALRRLQTPELYFPETKADPLKIAELEARIGVRKAFQTKLRERATPTSPQERI